MMPRLFPAPQISLVGPAPSVSNSGYVTLSFAITALSVPGVSPPGIRKLAFPIGEKAHIPPS